MKRLLAFCVIALLVLTNGSLYGQTGLCFLDRDKAIIDPTPMPGQMPVSQRVILVFSHLDFDLLCSLANAPESSERRLWEIPYREGSWGGKPVTIVGPVIGAPHGVMVLEMLIALKAKMVLAFGWCGSINSHVRIGHLMLPTSAALGDGTSGYYQPGKKISRPNPNLVELLKAQLAGTVATWHQGSIWSTDAIYRETALLIIGQQYLGRKAMDMETAALFTVGQFRGVPVAALHAVSDELFTLKWKSGFGSFKLLRARELTALIVLDTAAVWEGE